MRGEGLPASDIGKEIVRHTDEQHRQAEQHRRHREALLDRRLSISEAVLLSLVALLAGWSGYAAAKWATESSIILSHESTARAKASRAHLESLSVRNFDSSTFGAWFSAYTVHNRQAQRLAVKRFRPDFRAAFDAWRATHPDTNPKAPPGPTYMPQYHQPGLAVARAYDEQADHDLVAGEHAGRRSDDYVRVTVFLAIVLFVTGISSHFPVRGGRYLLLGLGTGLLIFSLVLVTRLPGPPH